jgi:hypothetical protein
LLNLGQILLKVEHVCCESCVFYLNSLLKLYFKLKHGHS